MNFDRERLDVVTRVLSDVRISVISARVIEDSTRSGGSKARNRTVNMEVGALHQVLKRFKQWRRLENDARMLTEFGGEPAGC